MLRLSLFTQKRGIWTDGIHDELPVNLKYPHRPRSTWVWPSLLVFLGLHGLFLPTLTALPAHPILSHSTCPSNAKAAVYQKTVGSLSTWKKSRNSRLFWCRSWKKTVMICHDLQRFLPQLLGFSFFCFTAFRAWRFFRRMAAAPSSSESETSSLLPSSGKSTCNSLQTNITWAVHSSATGTLGLRFLGFKQLKPSKYCWNYRLNTDVFKYLTKVFFQPKWVWNC